MVKLISRKPTDDDCAYIAEHTRPSDIAEMVVTVGSGMNMRGVVHQSYIRSRFCMTFCGPSSRPLAISGVVASPSIAKVGLPWMLGTTEMVKYPRQILIESKRFMKRALESGFEYLYNYVHDANEPSKRYLKVIGFKLHEPEPMGPYDALFRKFDMGVPQFTNTILAGGNVDGS